MIPDLAIPALPSAAIRAQAATALRAGATHYTDRAGIPELRAALAAALGGSDLAPDRVIITSGSQEGLFLALQGCLAAGSTVAVTGEPPAGVEASAELLESLGLRCVQDAAAADAVLRFSGATEPPEADAGLIISCESADLEPGWVSLVAAGLADSGLVVGDFAAAGLGGWRTGYLIGPASLMPAMVELKQGLNICTAAVSQHAAAGAAAGAVAGSVAAAAAAREPPAVVARPLAGRVAPPPARATARPSVSDEGTRQRYELLDLLARTPGAITLGRGDPDLETPAPIVEAAIAAMELPAGHAEPLGMPALRDAIARKLATDNGIVADPEHEILVTTGGQEAIFLLLQVLLGPGDEILMPSPRYTTYDLAVGVAGARIVDVAPRGPLDFSLDVAAIEAAITPRTRALLIISPGNPTAAVAGSAELEAVADLARRRGLTVISDEIYERIVYDGTVHTSIASLPGMGEQTVTVGGFSKAYAMTGWRVGYLAGPRELVAATARLKRLWSGPTSTIAQHGALAALAGGDELITDAMSTYRRRRRIVLDTFAELEIAHAPAQGAFYLFFDLAPLGLSSFELSRRLLTEAGVFLYPGSGFGERWGGGHMRLAWLAPEERLREGLSRLGDWVVSQRAA